MKIQMTKRSRKMMATLLGGALSLAAVLSGTFLTALGEGLVRKTYVDPAGVVTACYGHTGPALELGKTYTKKECLKFLMGDLNEAQEQVEKYIHVPLNLWQRAARIDFTHNLGPTNLKTSTIAKLFNKGDYVGGCKQLSRWVYANGDKLPGLVKRRGKDVEFCLGKVEIVYDY